MVDALTDPKTNVLHALRLLNRNQLLAVARRLEWCAIDPVGLSNEEFRDRIRNQAETALAQEGEANWEAFLRYLRLEFIDGRDEPTADRIERVLGETEVMPLSGSAVDPGGADGSDWRREELWYSAQLYGALRNEFSVPGSDPHPVLPLSKHLVRREHAEWGIAVDLYVRDEREKRPYLIEVKRAAGITAVDAVINQLYRYNTIFEDREHTYLLVLYDPREDRPAPSFHDIGDAIQGTLERTRAVRNEIIHPQPRGFEA